MLIKLILTIIVVAICIVVAMIRDIQYHLANIDSQHYRERDNLLLTISSMSTLVQLSSVNAHINYNKTEVNSHLKKLARAHGLPPEDVMQIALILFEQHHEEIPVVPVKWEGYES